MKAIWANLPQTLQADLRTDWDMPILEESPRTGAAPKYRVSPEDLAVYQSYASNVRIWHNTGLGFDGESLLVELVNRYLAGNLTAEELLDTLDERWSMMLLEKQ